MNLKNKIKSKLYNQFKKIEIKDHQLKYLFLEITRRCNLNCLHCGSDCIAQTNAPELTTESWLKIITYINNNFGKDVAFVITGGEPLVHPDLEKIGTHISRLGMRWGMVTNGMLINENRLKKLTDAGIYSITLSYDGIKNTHNKLRNSPLAYDRLISALELLGKSEIKLKDVVTCAFPDNLNQFNEIADSLINLKIPAWRIFRIFPSGRAKDNDSLLLTYEQTWEMVNWIRQNKKKYRSKGLNLNLSCEGWLPYDIDHQVRDVPFFCRAGINIASILCDGNITGCSNNHKSFYTGNILYEDFAQVWETKFNDFRKREWINATICNTCEYLSCCQGGSIHLWSKETLYPNFCYAKNLGNKVST